MHPQKTKQKLFDHIQYLLSERKEEVLQAIASAKESRDSDSKSSVGDKHETSRAQAQIEIDKLEIQLDKALHLEKEFSTIHWEKEHQQVEMGSLVFTNHENYFISVGIGKIELESETFYAISLASPMGKALQGKKSGDQLTFHERKILVKEII